MGVFTGIIVYLLIWWTLLFAVLPFGHERDEKGLPVFVGMRKKLIMNTLLSIVLWVLIFILIEKEVISFRDMAFEMVEEDRKR